MKKQFLNNKILELNQTDVIRLNLQNSAILHEFAYAEDAVLNPLIEDYIVKQLDQIKPKATVEIEVLSKPDDVPVFKSALTKAFNRRVINARNEIKKKRLLALIMLLFGTFFLAVGYLFSGYSFIYEILLVASWVFFWRTFELFFFEVQEARITILRCQKIIKANIKFT